MPAPPAPLVERLHDVLSGRLDESATQAHVMMLESAESLLAELIALGCAQRDRALDLLVVDAMVTYAFEAAAESPDTLADDATTAMASIARLATPTLIA